MKEFVRLLFSENNSSLQIGLFDVWHFLYLFVILGGAISLSFIFHGKSKEARDKLLKVMAYLTIGFYIADFFIMPLSDSYNGIGIDKLPFHICTLMGVMVPFAQFNKRFAPIKKVIVILSIASSLMWMCYPGSALGGEPPFSYIIFQTFMFHGFLFTWGVLSLTIGEVKLEIGKIWQELCGIIVILLWSGLGNNIYDNQNWFFTKESIFDFLPDNVMPPVVVFCVFGVCLIIYGAYYLVHAVAKHVAATQKHSNTFVFGGK